MIGLVKYLLRLWRGRRPGPASPVSPGSSSPGSGTDGADSAAAADAVGRADVGGADRPAAAGGPLALLAHQLRFDLLAGVRNPRARFLTVFFPVAMLVIFAGVFHGMTTVDGVHIKLSRYFATGILAMSIVLASYANLVVAIAALRESGVLKRRRATPVSPAILIGGQALSLLVSTATMTALLLVIARLLYGVGVDPGQIAAIVCTAALGTVTFACLAYAVSTAVDSPDSAQPLVQATTMPLWFISGVLIPTEHISGVLRTIGSVFPVGQLAAGLHTASVHASFGSAISVVDLLALGGWAVVAAAIAVWRFSWLPNAARG